VVYACFQPIGTSIPTAAALVHLKFPLLVTLFNPVIVRPAPGAGTPAMPRGLLQCFQLVTRQHALRVRTTSNLVNAFLHHPHLCQCIFLQTTVFFLHLPTHKITGRGGWVEPCPRRPGVPSQVSVLLKACVWITGFTDVEAAIFEFQDVDPFCFVVVVVLGGATQGIFINFIKFINFINNTAGNRRHP